MKQIAFILILFTLFITGCESAKPQFELREGEANTTKGTAPADSKK